MTDPILNGNGHRDYSPVDSLQLYLREIGQFALITPAEEILLAKRIKKGDAKAREQMITANLRLVVKIALDYENLGLPLLDLINEGNIGLMKAVERFDPSRGAKFSTYGAWWIKQSIRNAIGNQSRTVRMAISAFATLQKINKVFNELVGEFGRIPTDEEVADELGIGIKRILQVRRANTPLLSIESPTSNDHNQTIQDTISDPNAVDPSSQTVTKSDVDALPPLLEKLSEYEQTIIRMRYGLDTRTQMTLEDVGKRFNLTGERIRQIEAKSLKKLRGYFGTIEVKNTSGLWKRKKARIIGTRKSPVTKKKKA